MEVVYALVVQDRVTGRLLDASRLLSNPWARLRAHVTVRGPYPMSRRQTWNVQTTLTLGGRVGRFYDRGRHAVYLPCESDDMKQVWDKPDFPGYHPHLSIYHGMDIEVANDVQDILRAHPAPLRVQASGLVPLTVGGTPEPDVALDADEVCRFVLPGRSPRQLVTMSWRERRALLAKVVDELTALSDAPEVPAGRRLAPLSQRLAAGAD